jgi:phenylalanyl-tRNA synthetase alpha chain
MTEREARLASWLEEARETLASADGMPALLRWERAYLSRKSPLAALFSEMKDLPAEEKRSLGPQLQEARTALQEACAERKRSLEAALDEESEAFDITAPGIRPVLGHLHPITRLEAEVEEIFRALGFDFYDGPELETEHYNFDALNFPKDHPARDMQDTFWVKSPQGRKQKRGGRLLLRTHTSPGQVRYLERHKPPLRVVVPGRVFRNEATDASHEHTFHQFECLMVDEAGKVTVATFKYLAALFFEQFFGTRVQVRLRPSFFPFTEPSFEFDISCVLCGAQGCTACKQTGWLEIGGAGMVNQRVFEASGYPRGKYQGFAWGFGLTRLAMMKYRITDIRLLLSGDLGFLRQF